MFPGEGVVAVWFAHTMLHTLLVPNKPTHRDGHARPQPDLALVLTPCDTGRVTGPRLLPERQAGVLQRMLANG